MRAEIINICSHKHIVNESEARIVQTRNELALALRPAGPPTPRSIGGIWATKSFLTPYVFGNVIWRPIPLAITLL
jgi:hypothetical protein